MISTIAAAALVGVAAAAPWGPLGGGRHGWPGSPHGAPHHGSSGQVPFKFPLSNGFPNIEIPSSELSAIETQAHGTLPNTALPTHLSATTITDFQVIAENEIFEVAYFTSLLNNVTENVPGYEIPNSELRDLVITALTSIRAQEELHSLGANAILTSAGADAIKPCEYVFPVSNFNDAITLAYTFTDVVLGALQGVQSDTATDGDSELVPLIGSIIGQEGEQNGFYRSLEDHIPSSLPFLTRTAGPFAWSAINQDFIVPGSCPNPPAVPIFGVLNVLTPHIQAKDQTLTFSFDNAHNVDVGTLSLVYVNQQNTPIVEKMTNVQTHGSTVTFQANFPYTANLLNSLTLAAVTQGATSFASVPAVANATLFGPGLIEIN